jgi:hypothetical protein
MPRRGRKPAPHDILTEGDAIGVLLSNRPERVWVDRADYERIIAAKGVRAWSWHETGSFVRIAGRAERDTPVARLVLEVGKGGTVHFADGDRLNLRRANVSIGSRQHVACSPRRPYGKRRKRPAESDGQPVPVPNLPPRHPTAPTVIPKRTVSAVTTVRRG